MNCVFLQVCQNCESHSWKLKHQQSEFKKKTEQLSKVIKQLNLKFLINYPPAHLQHVKDDIYFNKHNLGLVSFPRLGSFQIFIGANLVFSKLSSSRFPSFSEIGLYFSRRQSSRIKYSPRQKVDRIFRSKQQNRINRIFHRGLSHKMKQQQYKSSAALLIDGQLLKQRDIKYQTLVFYQLSVKFHQQLKTCASQMYVLVKGVNSSRTQQKYFFTLMEWKKKVAIEFTPHGLIFFLFKDPTKLKWLFKARVAAGKLIQRQQHKIQVFGRTAFAGYLHFKVHCKASLDQQNAGTSKVVVSDLGLKLYQNSAVTLFINLTTSQGNVGSRTAATFEEGVFRWKNRFEVSSKLSEEVQFQLLGLDQQQLVLLGKCKLKEGLDRTEVLNQHSQAMGVLGFKMNRQ